MVKKKISEGKKRTASRKGNAGRRAVSSRDSRKKAAPRPFPPSGNGYGLPGTEEALLEAMCRFSDLFEQSPIGVGIFDKKGELVLANSAYLSVSGVLSFRDIAVQNLFRDAGLTREQKSAVRVGKTIEYESSRDKSREDSDDRVYVLSTVSPLVRSGKMIGHMCHARDITQRRKVERSQRLAHLGRLVADVAHEVNNPLMVISGRAELALAEKDVPEKVSSALRIIVDQCFQAKSVLRRVLSFSRIGVTDRTPLDVGEQIRLICGILSHHLEMSDVRLSCRVSPGLPMVSGNGKQIQQVLMNIMRNSADAMPEGGHIAVKAAADKGMVRIEVRDTGAGMSPGVLKRIFEPFYTTKGHGTGLGLAVCQSIVEEHGGRLKYRSSPGKGTTATLWLPSAREGVCP